jgi:hypothetical protein
MSRVRPQKGFFREPGKRRTVIYGRWLVVGLSCRGDLDGIVKVKAGQTSALVGLAIVVRLSTSLRAFLLGIFI